MEQEDTAKLGLGSLGSLDFTPDWAKKDAGVSVGNVRDRGERGERGERKPQSDRRQQGGKPAFRRQQGGGDGRFGGGRPPRFQERPQPLAVDVKVLPETRSLGTIMRKLQQDFHAYKLKDLAYFFLDNPQSVLLKITPARGADGRPVSDARAVASPALCLGRCWQNGSAFSTEALHVLPPASVSCPFSSVISRSVRFRIMLY